MRELVLDTETTGLNPASGHRVVEIGCIELINHLPTGREYHTYINPERDMPEEAFQVHGLSQDFLSDKPVFAQIADEFLAFIGEDPLVIHNAEFDMRFLNAEMGWLKKDRLGNKTVDTLIIARQRFPGAQANLDALCRRFDIDLSQRDKHGALLDAQLLADVYLELVGGREPGLGLGASAAASAETVTLQQESRERRAPRHDLAGARVSAEEAAAHTAFLEKLKEPVWRRADDTES